MASVNKVTLIGNLGADPEVKYTQSGSAVCNLRVATTERWNDKEGNKQERTEWHSVTVWGKQAEHCGQYLTKGSSVYVEGRLESREYQDKEGATRKVWDVVASDVKFLGGRGGDGERGGGAGAQGGERGGGGGGGGGNQGGGWGGNNRGNQGGGSGGGGGGNGGGSWGGGGNRGQGHGGGGARSGNQGGGGGGWGGGGGGGGRSQPPDDGDDPIPF